MGTKTSYLLAAMVAGGLGYWMYSGEVVQGGQGDDPDSLPPAAERGAGAEEAMAVRVREVTASIRENALQVRGRAEAGTRVEVRSETSGAITEVLVAKGDTVEAGDELCRIDRGARSATLSQAEAALQQAQFDYDSTVTLAERGVVAEARVRSARAALDAARAGVAQAEEEIGRVAVTAPIAGVIEDPLAEIGDVLAVGAVCATIVQTDPMLAIGQVSERDIAKLRVGGAALVTPLGAEPKRGVVSYIAPTAEAQTRTFRVEVTVPNADGVLRDGMTSTIEIPLQPTRAHALTASTLTLNDDGVIGVRTLGEGDTVVFMPVDIVADGREGVWVTGLPETVTVITVGQEYVAHGARVRALPDEREIAISVPDAPADAAPPEETDMIVPVEDIDVTGTTPPADGIETAVDVTTITTAQTTVELETPEAGVSASSIAPAPDLPSPEIVERAEPLEIVPVDPTARPATGDELRTVDVPPLPPRRGFADPRAVASLPR